MIRKILITNPRSEYVAITVDISFLRSLAPKNIAASSALPTRLVIVVESLLLWMIK